MRRISRIVVLAVAALMPLLSITSAQAAIVHMEADLLFFGQPNVGQRNFMLRLFDSQTGGNLLYSSADSKPSTVGEHFSVDFGVGEFGGPIDDSLLASPAFIELLVDGRQFDRVELLLGLTAVLAGTPIDTTVYQIDANFSAATTSVPEPASLALMGIALAGLAATRRRKQ